LTTKERLKQDDIHYIFDHAEVDSIIVDEEFSHLLDGYRESHPKVHVILDPVSADNTSRYE
jgi:pyridoxal/pyridoxine/pyridoxamine kinase